MNMISRNQSILSRVLPYPISYGTAESERKEVLYEILTSISPSDKKSTKEIMKHLASMLNSSGYMHYYVLAVYDFFSSKGMDVLDWSGSHKEKDIKTLLENSVALVKDIDDKLKEAKEYAIRELDSCYEREELLSLCTNSFSELENAKKKISACMSVLQEKNKVNLTQFLLIISQYFVIIGDLESTKTLMHNLVALQDDWKITSEDEKFVSHVREYARDNL